MLLYQYNDEIIKCFKIRSPNSHMGSVFIGYRFLLLDKQTKFNGERFHFSYKDNSSLMDCFRQEMFFTCSSQFKNLVFNGIETIKVTLYSNIHTFVKK
jgi:hypothetical protein